MAVGKVGSRKGAGAARGAGAAKKAAGPALARVQRVEPMAPAISLGEVSAAASPSEPMVARAAEIARQFRDGAIKTKEEATRHLVANILREIVQIRSKVLTDKIAQELEGDPRLRETLERIWAKAE